jgi:lysophospholipase L1-like esterase
MNDGGDPNINTPCKTWATNRDKVIALSEECGFEIVFVTIPTIPTRSHEAKNKWIRESGYRYIDMAAALGADGTGAWHEGYLSSDGVHPTNSGGKAIYEKIVADLPEFSKARNEDGQ